MYNFGAAKRLAGADPAQGANIGWDTNAGSRSSELLGGNSGWSFLKNERRQNLMSPVSTKEDADLTYTGLYRVGGVAALVVALLTVIEVIFFIVYPQPSTVSGWFESFQGSPIIGLLDFWGLELFMYAMFILVFLALYMALKRVNQWGMVVALTLALLGVAIFFATNNPFSMLTLSNKYAAAMTEVQRSTLLAAGEAVLANTNQRAVGGFNIGLFLVSTAGLIVSLVMLRATSFSRLTAYIGILEFGLSLADYIRQAITSSVAIALLVILPGALLLVIWFSLIGWRLLQLGRLRG
jgi:hypothetical protein